MDKVYILNASKKLSTDTIIDGIADIAALRNVGIKEVDCQGAISKIANQCYNPKRGQMDCDMFLDKIHNTNFMRRNPEEAKIITLDHDFYAPSLNWCFGGFNGTTNGLGYIQLSTARLQNEDHARDLVRHELGHMFGAAPAGRPNTYEHLGSHCSNDLCVMQQKDTVQSAAKYAKQRKKLNVATFCGQCEDDILNFVPRNKR